MYNIVKTELTFINGRWIWIKVPYQTQTKTLQEAAEICEALNMTCDETESFHAELQQY